MIIDCISDLHGEFPTLKGGDLLIVAGDLTGSDDPQQYADFCEWIYNLDYTKKIVIAGNHDNFLQKIPEFFKVTGICEYLCDSGTEFEGLKIWGSPWTAAFHGMNPDCAAFTINVGCDTDQWLAEKWALIPNDTDILITHSPSFGNYDWVYNIDGTIGPSVGSVSLWLKCLEIQPKLHIFGHIHAAYGHSMHHNGIHLVNASHMNERYEPVNPPIRIELC
jgi:Icc-related predicted phosphoesterase